MPSPVVTHYIRSSNTTKDALMPDTITDFAIADRLTFEAGDGGLVRGVIRTDLCEAEFYLHGAHVTHFQPTGNQPLLFLSPSAVFSDDKAIRGGVPICFPWFGSHPTDHSQPSHGLARTRPWHLVKTWEEGPAIGVELQLDLGDTKALYRMRFADALKLELEVQNLQDEATTCEVALHTYLPLGDITQVQIEGLEGQPFLDQLSGQQLEPTHTAIRFDRETDRIYHGSVPEIRLVDEAWQRTVRIQPDDSKSTVVWNPWIEKSQRMSDLGDDDYLGFCCIETANIAPNHMQVPGHESKSVGVTLSVVNAS